MLSLTVICQCLAYTKATVCGCHSRALFDEWMCAVGSARRRLKVKDSGRGGEDIVVVGD